MISQMSNDIEVSVQGHTDNLPIPSNSPYKDNWELSTARAVAVVKELIADRVKAKRLAASGHAQFKPIATNATPEGRARNRRVELHFISKNQQKKNKTIKSVLDTGK